MHPFPLTPKNRLVIARAFRESPRVDCSIACVIEGQMGKVFVDNPENPSAFAITTGPFWYYAGDPSTPGALELMQAFPRYTLLMPSPIAWVDLAHQVRPDLQPMARYQFRSDSLTAPRLESLLASTKHSEGILPIDQEQAARLAQRPEDYFEIDSFDSANDFLERGFGYVSVGTDGIQGAAFSSLVNSQAIEISIYVEERSRERGVATALACRLILDCLRHGLHPNWDAANPESCKLALKLGYTLIDSYDAFYYE